MLEPIAYIIFCVLTGLCGSKRRMGVLGTFILALILTPLIMLPVLLLTGRSARAAERDRS